MKIIIKETGKGLGQQTLVKSDQNKYYVVSSITGLYANETMIFGSDEDGVITNFGEMWATKPAQHENILSMLESRELTEEDFYFDADD